jgi:hypothetical protein
MHLATDVTKHIILKGKDREISLGHLSRGFNLMILYGLKPESAGISRFTKHYNDLPPSYTSSECLLQ